MVKYRTKAPLAFSEQHVSSRTVMYMRYKGSFLLQTVLAKGPHHNHQIFVGWHISWTSHHIYILIPHSSGTKLHTSFDSALSSCVLDNAKASIDLGCYWESPWLCQVSLILYFSCYLKLRYFKSKSAYDMQFQWAVRSLKGVRYREEKKNCMKTISNSSIWSSGYNPHSSTVILANTILMHDSTSST